MQQAWVCKDQHWSSLVLLDKLQGFVVCTGSIATDSLLIRQFQKATPPPPAPLHLTTKRILAAVSGLEAKDGMGRDGEAERGVRCGADKCSQCEGQTALLH